jgi:uncharacterized protein
MAPIWLSMADPVHGLIQFDRTNLTHRLLLEVINSFPFQRLRRIRQMGLAEFVFPGATHTRFMHCIGATWLTIQAIEHLKQDPHGADILNQPIGDTGIKTDMTLLMAVLLHDIGHPPLSHTLEYALALDKADALHDAYWNQEIIEADADLKRIWDNAAPTMPQAIQQFMGGGDSKKHFLADLVSSQLDMDRLDYLVRDSHYLGVQYGRIETQRLIKSMTLSERDSGEVVLALREEALPGLEHYLFGRHQAYKMASHALDKASEMLLKKTIQRFAELVDTKHPDANPNELLVRLMKNPKSLRVDEYLILDDGYLWELIKRWAFDAKDSLLKLLASRLLRHDLYKVIDLSPYLAHRPELIEKLEATLRDHAEREKMPPEYYYQIETIPSRLFYHQDGRPIWIQRQHGPVVEFTDVSSFANAPKQPDRTLLFLWDRVAKVLARSILDD